MSLKNRDWSHYNPSFLALRDSDKFHTLPFQVNLLKDKLASETTARLAAQVCDLDFARSVFCAIRLRTVVLQARNQQLLDQNNALLKQLSELLYTLSRMESKCGNDTPWSNSNVTGGDITTDFNFLGDFVGGGSVSTL